MKIYYAHCKAIYGTPQETRDIELLEELRFEVLNPNDPYHEKIASRLKKGGSSPMLHFIGLVEVCDALAFRALPSGEIPAGVAKEIQVAAAKGIPIIELPGFALRRGLSVDRTRDYLREVGQR